MIPPFKTPGNASYFACGIHSATTSPFLMKLRICKPSRFAGPHPKQEFFGAYCSWSDFSFINLPFPLNLTKREHADEEVGELFSRAGIFSQLRSGVERAGTNQAIVIVLLNDVRAPTGHARSGQERRVEFRVESKHPKDGRGVKNHIH